MMIHLAQFRHGKSLAALGAFGAAILGAAVWDASLVMWVLNPLDLPPSLWLVFYVAKCAGLALVDAAVGAWLKQQYADKPLPYRAKTGAVGLENLEWIDYTYLTINSIIETIFTSHVVRLVITSPHMAWRPADISLFNTLPALYLIFAIDDLLYAPAHKLMHAPWFYPYVHKHHHRQNLPVRGYLDAGNEHPIEQVIGVTCLWLTLQLVSRLTSVHALTILVHFLLYAALALLNHTNYDVRFSFFGFEYAVGAHETHHRYPQTNMAQYFMIWDKLMGTYKPYVEGRP
ncbi:hypothetical protein CTAYLR_007847 [Chrysophaeum taylorii]|uniref:Fatty acid hydroxylase domain-containing protein n=1 Tax=Chrysophaeum taylorii TaxID=2483200 RepID=A0AAD7XNH1_9STRA|nr:hypothetical protein CTAYLR_007847 [Chrysophaeum taylorii]